MNRPLIAPSILASDFANLEKEVQMINQSEADWVHVDIMDGVFVPNISFGIPVTAAIHKHSKKPLDVHLMIVQPERYVEAFSSQPQVFPNWVVQRAVMGRLKCVCELGEEGAQAPDPRFVAVLQCYISEVPEVKLCQAISIDQIE